MITKDQYTYRPDVSIDVAEFNLYIARFFLFSRERYMLS